MTHSIKRRHFLAGSAAAVATGLGGLSSGQAGQSGKSQEFYELRIYKIPTAQKQQIVNRYLQRALLPALNRLEVDRVGVFTQTADKPAQVDHSVFVLIPYRTLTARAELNSALAADRSYQRSAAELFALPKKDPAYTRIQSYLMKAFAGMPVIELPAQTVAKKPRIFELRTYQSHNEEKARLKVDMFNSGEIDVMREVKLAPVFYGEMLIGDNVPCLTYMLSAPDRETHKAHWKAFIGHPGWERLKSMTKYKDTVSKISNWFLMPTSFSQI